MRSDLLSMNYVLAALCGMTSYTKPGRQTLAARLLSAMPASTKSTVENWTVQKEKQLIVQASNRLREKRAAIMASAPPSNQEKSRLRQSAIPTPNANTAVEIDGIGGP